MTALADISRERLDQWAKSMSDVNATPVLCLAVGHGETSGELHLYAPTNFSDADLEQFVWFALRELQLRKAEVAV